MSCNLITSDIVNSCTSVRGLNHKAWIFPFVGTTVFFETREDAALQDYKVVNLIGSANQTTPTTFEAFKYGLNAGLDAVVSEVRATTYKGYFSGVLKPSSAAQIEALDKMDGIIVVVLTNDGKYLVIGAENGLWKSSQTQRANDNTGLVTVEYVSREGIEESQSEYLLESNLTGVSIAPLTFLDSMSYVEGFTATELTATSTDPIFYAMGYSNPMGDPDNLAEEADGVITIQAGYFYKIFYNTLAGLIIS